MTQMFSPYSKKSGACPLFEETDHYAAKIIAQACSAGQVCPMVLPSLMRFHRNACMLASLDRPAGTWYNGIIS
jgi:hypothetical protein